MRFKLQNIALGYFIKSKKENKPNFISNNGFFNIDWKAISYESKDTIISWLREIAYPFIQAVNFDSTNWTFNNDHVLLEKLNKIKTLNKFLFKVLERLAFKENSWKIEMVKINTVNRILSIMNEKTFLLEVKQEMIDDVISWIYTLWRQNPWLLTKQELAELEVFYNWDELESIQFPIVNEWYMKNRLNLARREKNIITNEWINWSWLLKKWFSVKDFNLEVWNILLNTNLTWEIQTTQEQISFFSSTTPRLTEEALDIILN